MTDSAREPLRLHPPAPQGFRWVFANQRVVDEDGDGIGTFYADIVLAPIED